MRPKCWLGVLSILLTAPAVPARSGPPAPGAPPPSPPARTVEGAPARDRHLSVPASESIDPPPPGASHLRPSAALTWFAPLSGPTQELYGGRPSLGAGLEYGDSRARVSGAFRTDIYRAAGDPAVPAFVSQAHSTLWLVPLQIEGGYHFSRDADPRPYFTLGAVLWVVRESFRYQLLGRDGRAEETRVAPGLTLGGGVELGRVGGPTRTRIAFRYYAGRLDRRRIGDRIPAVDAGGTDDLSGVQLGLEWVLR